MSLARHPRDLRGAGRAPQSGRAAPSSQRCSAPPASLPGSASSWRSAATGRSYGSALSTSARQRSSPCPRAQSPAIARRRWFTVGLVLFLLGGLADPPPHRRLAAPAGVSRRLLRSAGTPGVDPPPTTRTPSPRCSPTPPLRPSHSSWRWQRVSWLLALTGGRSQPGWTGRQSGAASPTSPTPPRHWVGGRAGSKCCCRRDTTAATVATRSSNCCTGIRASPTTCSPSATSRERRRRPASSPFIAVVPGRRRAARGGELVSRHAHAEGGDGDQRRPAEVGGPHVPDHRFVELRRPVIGRVRGGLPADAEGGTRARGLRFVGLSRRGREPRS